MATPEGKTVLVDLQMAPLMGTLWRNGWTTDGCCQNLGESIDATTNPGRRKKFADFYKGMAWIKIRVPDAEAMMGTLLAANPRFYERFNRWTMPGAWDVYNHLVTVDSAAGPRMALSAWTQMHFPVDQLEEVTGILGDR